MTRASEAPSIERRAASASDPLGHPGGSGREPLAPAGQQRSSAGGRRLALRFDRQERDLQGDGGRPRRLRSASTTCPTTCRAGWLPKIYGAGAFPISYPNDWDRFRRRSGSGIWIHGTDKDDGELPPQSSRGCLTLHNNGFEALVDHVQVARTPVLLHDQVEWVSPSQHAAGREELVSLLEGWRTDWESLDTEKYLENYGDGFRTETMDLDAWSKHKRRVNRAKEFIDVEVSDLGIFRYPGEEDVGAVRLPAGLQEAATSTVSSTSASTGSGPPTAGGSSTRAAPDRSPVSAKAPGRAIRAGEPPVPSSCGAGVERWVRVRSQPTRSIHIFLCSASGGMMPALASSMVTTGSPLWIPAHRPSEPG